MDWGDVPTWLTAGSILIGVEELRRRRMDDERQQVDQIALWCTQPGTPLRGGSCTAAHAVRRVMIAPWTTEPRDTPLQARPRARGGAQRAIMVRH